MSTTAVDALAPITIHAPRKLSAIRNRWTARRDLRSFQRAVRLAGPDERSDLLAAARRL